MVDFANSPEFERQLCERRKARMDAIDRLSSAERQIVHEYGYNVFCALRSCGVAKPKQMRHIVETVLDEFSPTRGSSSSQGTRISFDRGAA
jgi:hypothetical protein